MLRRVACLAFLTTCQALLVENTEPRVLENSANGACKQLLKATQQGMAYLSPLTIGGQEVNAILDTGSFEVVVESTDCPKCPEATYDPRKSKAYMHELTQSHTPPFDADLEKDAELLAQAKTKMGQRAHSQLQSAARFQKENMTTITYGSGPVSVVAGSDTVSVPGCDHLKTERIGIQEVLDHEIPLLQMPGAMTAIVGMGAGMANQSQNRLHNHLGSPRFSFCLAADRNADGVIWWNEPDRSDDQHFTSLDMIGKQFWGFSMNRVSLGNETVGCTEGCGAILDTGTSLLTFDRDTTNQIAELWSKMGDCSNYHDLPSMKLKLGEQELTLPPEAYVAITTGEVPMLEQELVGTRLPLSQEMTKDFFLRYPETLIKRLQAPDMADIIQQILGGMGGGKPEEKAEEKTEEKAEEKPEENAAENAEENAEKEPQTKTITINGGNMQDIIERIMGGGAGGAPNIKDILDKITGQMGGMGGGDLPMQPACQLLLTPPMDLGMTPYGPMTIIGMPFFRSYYTTFDDTDPENRKVLISKSLNCHGEKVSRNLVSAHATTTNKLRHLSNMKDHTSAAVENAKGIASFVRAHGM